MKVLWLGGIVLPRIAQKENLPINNTNGWLISLSETIGHSEGYELVYLFDSPRNIEGKNEFYSYYGIEYRETYGKVEESYKAELTKIIKSERPDVIHVWGTERPHTLALVEVCNDLSIIDRVVISIQGLVSKIYHHYTAYLPQKVVNHYTLRDMIKGNLAKTQKRYSIIGENEENALHQVKHVIGRTEWDKACVWDINPDVHYYYNNEVLREEFYEDSWKYDECEHHSIFFSQSHYPLKGLHLLLSAMPRVKREYPDVKLYVAGLNHREVPKWKRSSYTEYILSLIAELDLENVVEFTGSLNADAMKNRYLKSNVFVSASAIENSPNSVGEAMILGIPTIASNVGGTSSLLSHEKEGYLYPADEPYMLPYYISRVFSDQKLSEELSQNARERALRDHDRKENLGGLLGIYKKVMQEKESR